MQQRRRRWITMAIASVSSGAVPLSHVYISCVIQLEPLIGLIPLLLYTGTIASTTAVTTFGLSLTALSCTPSAQIYL